jgi:hypothetical protein
MMVEAMSAWTAFPTHPELFGEPNICICVFVPSKQPFCPVQKTCGELFDKSADVMSCCVGMCAMALLVVVHHT